MTKVHKFNFEITSSELNCLVRDLNRKFLTVVADAVSNSWDADANNVWISIDFENSSVTIRDDGKGMTIEEFQGCYLRIGNSKHKIGGSTLQKNRPVIGSKGVGMLSNLLYSDRITIVTKTETTDCIGGTIDYHNLVKAITVKSESNNYVLEELDVANFNKFTLGSAHGTLVHLENVCMLKTINIAGFKEDIALGLKLPELDSDFCLVTKLVLHKNGFCVG